MDENALNIIHVNIQSIRNKIDELKELVRSIEIQTNKKIHIIAISEIWIYENENKYYNIDGFNVYFSNRSNNRSGGCGIYILTEIESTLIKQFEYECSNFVLIKLNKFDIKIACIYRYGRADIHKFNEKFEDEILKYKKILIVGDININLKNECNETKNYIDTFKSNGITCLNNLNDNFYTRKSNTICTIIDHILTDIKELKFNISLIDSYISDHRLIVISYKPHINKNYTIKNKKNQIQVIDYDNIQNDINENNVIGEKDFEIFHKKITEIIQKNTKTIQKKKQRIRKEWANAELIYLIKIRDKFYKKYITDQNNINFKIKFEEFKIKARNLRNHLRKKYNEKRFHDNMNDNRKIWKIINSTMYNKEHGEVNSIHKLEFENQIVNENEKIANIFNTHFTSNIKVDTMINFRKTNYENIQQFQINKCTEEEISTIIQSLRNNASNGYDNISAKLIKKYKQLFAPILTEHINNIIENGKYPESLKIGTVIPIHKKGKKTDCTNYRPITKLSAFDKILEQVLLIRLQDHLKFNNIIQDNQFGFVKNSNTLAACINCMENIYKFIEKDQYIALLSIDLEKAFDSTNINILIKKLNEINIADKELEIFQTFLNNRKQYVQIEKEKSKIETIKIGIPQGAKLAATLFIIYINGILKLNLKSLPQFYADDGLFIFNGKSYKELIENINHDLKILNEWFNDNHLKLNIKKTKIMLLKTKSDNDMNHFIGINFNNELIKREDSIKYLGLIIDEKLNWDKHIENIKNKLIPLCAAVFRIRKYLPKNILLKIYNAHFLSHVTYMNQIWTNTKEQNINDLQRIQNKIIKLIENKPRLTPSESLYRNRMNIRDINKYNMIVLIQKIKLKKTKFNFNLDVVQNVQKNYLRNLMNFRPNFFRKEKFKSSILSYGLNQYNKIPIEIKNITNLRLFKIKMKECIKTM